MSGAFPVTICVSNADTPEGDVRGLRVSWSAGAAALHSALAPENHDLELGADPMRNNDYDYKEMQICSPALCPLGAHARRLNPRETASHPQSPLDDPARGDLRSCVVPTPLRRRRGPGHRRVHHLCEPGAPVRVRPANVWVPNDGASSMYLVPQARPDLRHPRTAPWTSRFATDRSAGGTRGYGSLMLTVSISFCQESTCCATSPPSAMKDHRHARSHDNQSHTPRHRRPAHQHLLDVELSLGVTTGSGLHGRTRSTMTEVRNVLSARR